MTQEISMSAPQNYANHAHRPMLWTVGNMIWLAAVVLLTLAWGGRNTLYPGLLLLAASLWCSLAIGRVYITALQDRIIRLEMRVRAASLLSPAQAADLERLSIKQIVALRFSSDAEMPALLERAVREQLTPDQIKRAVQHWVADDLRT
jgi:hypothetical protein